MTLKVNSEIKVLNKIMYSSLVQQIIGEFTLFQFMRDLNDLKTSEVKVIKTKNVGLSKFDSLRVICKWRFSVFE